MVQLVCAGVGLWLIITGAVPVILFGRAKQPIPKRGARTIGLILFSIVPLSFLVRLLFQFLPIAYSSMYETFSQLFLTVSVAIFAVVVFRRISAEHHDSQ